MSEENNVWKGGLGVVGVLIFLMLCNAYQPNAQIATLTLTTIFMSIVWLTLIGFLIGIILFVIIAIAGAIFS